MNWINIAIEFVLSFLVTLVITLYLEIVLKKKKMTVPDAHKKDKPLVPRPGGFAVLVGTLLALLFVINSYALAFILSLSIAFLIGLVDDIKKFGGPEKPLLAILAALPVIFLHAYSSTPYLPYVGNVTIKILYPLLVLAGFPIYTNATNMIDIFNGVVTGVTAISVLPFLTYDFIKGNVTGAYLGIAFEASLLAFYLRHKYPSRIFPGDSGSMLMGAGIVTLMITSRAEVIGIVATLPLIFNGFFILSSIGGFKEHSELIRPLIVLDDYRMIANKDPKSPVTLARLIASQRPMSEKEIANRIMLLSVISSALSFITMMVYYI
ncbi:MAG: hypothetical protein GU362_04535 [Thaumarchaeota archaeon]|jgi:UDP-N-acetylglucosamine--dolichyl-phosphate N-acetylglucosaminephosphotransferase|nr:hypothetical protein [Nitrososphaerota archaeon]